MKSWDGDTTCIDQTHERELRQLLETVDQDASGAAIKRVARKRSPYSSWYTSEVVSVWLESGVELNFFLKDFGSYTSVKDAMEERRNREMRVYRDLLAGSNIGTAKYYGSIWDASRDRYWLLLEFVEGMPVRYCELEYWAPAAAWLGRMQGALARHPHLETNDFLLRHNAEFFWSKAEQALKALNQTSMAQRLQRILKTYDRTVTVMANQPRTLVHGAYRAKEVLVNPKGASQRICPVDWELAALGAPLYDLALFADGFDPDIHDRFCAEYREEARAAGLAPPDLKEMKYLLDCFRLHNVINWLSQSRDREFPPEKVLTLLDRGEQLQKQVA